MAGDPRIARGMGEQLGRRAAAFADGVTPVGWKLAFGAPAAQAKWEIGGAMVAGLTDATRLAPGGCCSTAGWVRPVLEAEVAVKVAAAGKRLVSGELALSIELADLADLDSGLERVLAGSIFHRAFVLGEFRPAPPEPPAIAVDRDGERIATAGDPWATIGDTTAGWVDYVRGFLAAHGEKLQVGDVLMTGSVVAPIENPGPGRIEVTAPGFGAVAVELS